MRIGILTLPLHTNYGGILQAYALQTVLERMGHEVMVLDPPRVRFLPLWKKPYSYPKRMVKKYLLRKKDTRIFQEEYSDKVQQIVCQHTKTFIDKHIHLKHISSLSDLKSNDFDCFIVGSDQVWRAKYFRYPYRKIENAYLQFAEGWNVKRIAYAASFGRDKIGYGTKTENECARLLRQFDAVSVREESAVDLCKTYFDVDATHVLDPTMLLSSLDYVDLFKSNNTPKSKGTLLNYILDETPEINSFIEHIAEDKGFVPFRVNSKVENRKAPIEERIQPPVEPWLRGFYDAEFVVTDSFHACVFSILFKKQFVVYGNAERGLSRFESLLKMFGLEDRLITDLNKAHDLSFIDYDKVYNLYNKKKEKSYSFLKSVLGN